MALLEKEIEVTFGEFDGEIVEVEVEDDSAIVERTLTKISNNAESVGDNVFRDYTTLQSVEFPLAKSVGAYAFNGCGELTSVDLPVATQIGAHSFIGCNRLASLILRSETMATLLYNALASTPIASGTGYIYVPAALIEDYKAAANWSTYAAQFRAIEDYPDICGAV